MDDDIAGIILQYNDTYQETLCLIIACMPYRHMENADLKTRLGAIFDPAIFDPAIFDPAFFDPSHF